MKRREPNIENAMCLVSDHTRQMGQSPDVILERKSTAMVLSQVLHGFPEAEHFVLSRRFGLDGSGAMTLAEIGEERGVVRQRIHQIEAKALRRLRENKMVQLLTP